MAITKKQLETTVDRHSRNIAELRSCPRADVLESSMIDMLRASGRDLMALLRQPMRKTVPTYLVEMGEGLVDKSTLLIMSRIDPDYVSA